MAERGHRSRRSRPYSKRSHRPRTSRDLCNWRHCFARTRRKATTGRGSGGHSTRSVRRSAYRSKLGLLSPPPKPFRYFDKGNIAVIGAGFAILQAGRVRLSGISAWLAWAGIHLQFLSTTSLRLSVLLQWIWSFLTGQTGVRLIVNHIPLSKPNKDVPFSSNKLRRPPTL